MVLSLTLYGLLLQLFGIVRGVEHERHGLVELD